MKNIAKILVMTAAVGLSVMFCSTGVKAAESEPLVKIEPIKAKKVSDRRFENIQKGAARVSSKSGFLKEFQKNAVKRKKAFSIYCSSQSNIDLNVYDKLDTIDNKKTSDDADFLKGGILSLGMSYSINSKGEALVNCKLVYTENAGQVTKVNTKAKKALKKLKVSKMSDVAKVKAIHDYVVNLVSYDNSLKDHSAYGGLAANKHSTVCQGYALIMYKLLTDAGVPCHYVTGDAGGPHAWNIVKIKGKWYYLDATWDDPSNNLVYDYFLVGSKTLKRDHRTDSYYTKKYSMSSSDCNWKKLIKQSKKKDDSKVGTTQTKEEIAAGKEAIARAEFTQMLNEAFDSVLNEDPDANEYMVQMYDLCKKIYGYVVQDMSDEAFAALTEDEEMFNYFLEGTLDYISEYILDPLTEYAGSDEFSDAVIEAMMADFSEEDFEGMSDDTLGSLYDAYGYEIFTEMLYAQSERYTDDIVNEVVETLNGMV